MKTVKVRKIGNSLGIILPRYYTELLGVERGDELEVFSTVSRDNAGIGLRKINTIT